MPMGAESCFGVMYDLQISEDHSYLINRLDPILPYWHRRLKNITEDWPSYDQLGLVVMAGSCVPQVHCTASMTSWDTDDRQIRCQVSISEMCLFTSWHLLFPLSYTVSFYPVEVGLSFNGSLIEWTCGSVIYVLGSLGGCTLDVHW